jgi:hypothetical protein
MRNVTTITIQLSMTETASAVVRWAHFSNAAGTTYDARCMPDEMVDEVKAALLKWVDEL